MGSENSPLVLFQAVLKAAFEYSQVVFTLFIDHYAFDLIYSHPSYISASFLIKSRLKFYKVNEVILMTDEPLLVLKKKMDSSLVKGLDLLKQKEIHAFVTSGNTGALIAATALFIPSLPSIKRPALLVNLPTTKGKVSIIDVGGNVSCRASQLIQFTQMAIAYHQSLHSQLSTRVGLLNIGTESKKGTLEIRKVYDYFIQNAESFSKMQFIGNIEAREVFEGNVDVLITDGFAGNVLLKTAEGIYALIIQQLEKTLEFLDSTQKKFIIDSLRLQFDYEEHRGAIVCGVDGVIVKCHGNSQDRGMYHAICGAVELVQNNFIEKIKAFV